MTLYVVAGAPRTASSAVMAGLAAAGITPSYSVKREAQLQAVAGVGGYRANPGGFYEHEWHDLRRLGFTAEIPDGHAVKLRLMDTLILVPRPTVVIWTHRDWGAVLRSYERAGFRKDATFDNWPESFIEMERHNRAVLEDRKSVTAIVDIHYEDLFADPVREFSRIPGVEGALAATAIRPELKRN